MLIAVEPPLSDDVLALLNVHMTGTSGASPQCSDHTLSASELDSPDITFITARNTDNQSDNGNSLLGFGALKALDNHTGEIKSMHTIDASRGLGVGARLLDALLHIAQDRQYQWVALETGHTEFFASARRLYGRYGFVECGPFGQYQADPNSLFMCKQL